jgi:hypothetical protein
MPLYCRHFVWTFRKTEREKITGTTFNTKAAMKRVVKRANVKICLLNGVYLVGGMQIR